MLNEEMYSLSSDLRLGIGRNVRQHYQVFAVLPLDEFCQNEILNPVNSKFE